MVAERRSVAVVTGASSGIGAAVARRFGAEGWTVVLAARSKDKLQAVAKDVEAAGGRAVVVQADVGEEDDVARIAQAAGEPGHVDALVNAAGVGYGGKVKDLGTDTWEESLRTNLTGPFLVTRALHPLLKVGSTVVNVASVVALDGVGNLGAYVASKFGLRGLSQSYAQEVAKKGVRVVTLNPGYVATPMVEDAPYSFEDMIRPDDLADIIWCACNQPESVYVDEITVWPRKLYDVE